MSPPPFLGLSPVLGSASRGRRAAFSPLDYAPTAWWDATIPASILDAGGAAADLDEAVATWVDQSGNGADIVQVLDANDRPLRKDGYLHFDGTDDYLTTYQQSPSDLIPGNSSTVYLVMAVRSFVNNSIVWDTEGSGSRMLGVINTTAGNQIRCTGGNPTTGTDPLTAGVFAVVCMRTGVNFVGVTVNNGTEDSATPTISPTSVRFSLGGNGAIPAASCTQLNLAEAIVYDGLHDATQRSKVIGYLLEKHAIASLLVAAGFTELIAAGYTLLTTVS